MVLGIFDIFRIGLRPSSSHTVGPMPAAADFVARLETGTNPLVFVEFPGPGI